MNGKDIEKLKTEIEKKSLDEMKRNTRVMTITITIVTAIVFFVTVYYIVFFAGFQDSLALQNCGIVQDHSDQITTQNWFVLLGENIFIPVSTSTTQYHSYMMCLNGTKVDRGYLP